MMVIKCQEPCPNYSLVSSVQIEKTWPAVVQWRSNLQLSSMAQIDDAFNLAADVPLTCIRLTISESSVQKFVL